MSGFSVHDPGAAAYCVRSRVRLLINMRKIETASQKFPIVIDKWKILN
jgi:hypothetical protein